MAVNITRTADLAGVIGSGGVCTWSGASIGVAAADRIVVLLVGAELLNASPNSATIDYGSGHVAMTPGSLRSLASTVHAQAFYLAVPTGTTAEFKVTFGVNPGTAATNHAAVHRVLGANPFVITASGVTDTDADPITTGVVSVPTNGGISLICSDATDTTARTYAGTGGCTEDLDVDAGTFRFSTGIKNGGGNSTTTVSGNNSEDAALSYLVFGPADWVVPSSLTVATPTLGTPTLTINVDTTDDLVASSLTVAVPTLGTPTLGQKHAIVTTGLTVAVPTLGTPTLGQKHVLTATSLTVATPSLGQSVIPLASGHDGGSLFGGTGVDYGTSTFCAQSFTPASDIALIAVDLYINRNGAPADQVYCEIFATDGSGWPTGAALATSGNLSIVATQPYNFTFASAPNLTASVKYSVVTKRTGALSDVSNYTQWADSSDPHAGGRLAVYYGGAWHDGGSNWDNYLTLYGAGPALGFPPAVLEAQGLTVAVPTLGTPTLGQKHVIGSVGLTVAVPTFGFPAIGQTHVLSATPIALPAPTLGAPSLAITSALGAVGLTVDVPTLGTPSLGQKHVLTAVAIGNAVPTFGFPAIGQAHALSAVPIALPAPTFGFPAIGQVHALTAVAIGNASPVLGTPALGQTHVLTAQSLTVATPTLGEPVLIPPGSVVALSLTVAAPTLGTPSLGQTHVLSAVPIDLPAPTFGFPALGQTHILTATSIDNAAPTLGTPALVDIAVLSASSLTVGVPILTTPTLQAISHLIADSLIVAPPELGEPVFVETGTERVASGVLVASQATVSGVGEAGRLGPGTGLLLASRATVAGVGRAEVDASLGGLIEQSITLSGTEAVVNLSGSIDQDIVLSGVVEMPTGMIAIVDTQDQLEGAR